jgi:TRAP-type C4-dicarboxylate transport system substrate-binding protein
MRVADPLFGLMFKRAGAAVITMPSNEIHAALGSGSLDAVVTTYESIRSLRLYEQVKYATIGGPVLFMGFSPLVMSLSTWKRLTPEQKAAIDDAGALADSYYDSAQRDVEQRTEAALRAAGVTIRPMSKDDYLSWLQLAQQTAWLEYTKINPRSRDLLLALVSRIVSNMNEGK